MLDSEPRDSSRGASSSVENTKGNTGTSAGIGDSQFREIYEAHAAETLRYAIRCSGRRDVGEELASEAFLRLYQNRERIDPGRAGAWLTTAVRNLAIDYWRRRELERRILSETAAAAGGVRPREWENMLEHPSLKPEHRVCIGLHYVHGYDRTEISARTGLTDNQVKSCIQYGLKLLRKAFGVEP